MGQYTPPFPVTDASPSFSRVVGAIGAQDAPGAAAITLLGVPFGFVAGTGLTRVRAIKTAVLLGALGGFAFAYQNSAARLTGFKK